MKLLPIWNPFRIGISQFLRRLLTNYFSLEMIICHLYKEQDISNIFSTSIFPKYIFNESHPHSHQLCHQNPQNNLLFLVLFSSHNLYSTTIWSTAFAVVEVVKNKVVVRKLRRAQVKVSEQLPHRHVCANQGSKG